MSANRLRIEFLSEKELEYIEETSYKLLGEVGILLNHKEAVELLDGIGCQIKGERIKIPRQVVEWALKNLRPHRQVYNQNGSVAFKFGDGKLRFHNGGGPPFIYDLENGKRRSAILSDDELNTAMLYITHDLGVIAQICDRVIVMYAGNIAESGDVQNLFDAPKHPYTQALLRAHPSHRMHAHRLRTIPGLVPSLRDLPTGCKFAPRCELAQEICHSKEPELWEIGEQSALCHAYSPEWDGRSVESLVESTPLDSSPVETPDRKLSNNKVLIQIHDLHKHFKDNVGLLNQMLGQRAGTVKAVSGVDIEIRRGETLGLVGESGSGKTTLARTILRLLDPTTGSVIMNGKDISNLSAGEIRPLRSDMQMIFQDPFSSLDPRMKVSSLLLEPFRIHNKPVSGKEKVVELLAMVGLAAEQADKYPHQLSGGQARRLGIARALALEPDILLADEPTAGLDVSVAAGVLNLLKNLRDRLQLTYIIITHDLNVIGFISDRVAVMYLGRIVELAETEQLFSHPRHPYTEALMSAIPVPDPRLRGSGKRIILSGEIPSPRNPPSGCPFHPRCAYVEDRCRSEMPLLRPLDNRQRWVACHFPEKVQPQSEII